MEFFFNSLLKLMVVINPITVLANFLAGASAYTKYEKKYIVNRAVSIALVVLIIFIWFGQKLLSGLGLSMDSFKVTGGFLLVRSTLVNTPHSTTPKADLTDFAVFPLAIPLIAGPGAMTTIITVSNNLDFWSFERIILSTAVLVVLGLNYLALFNAEKVRKFIGETANRTIGCIGSIILATVGFQLILQGLEGLFKK